MILTRRSNILWTRKTRGRLSFMFSRLRKCFFLKAEDRKADLLPFYDKNIIPKRLLGERLILWNPSLSSISELSYREAPLCSETHLHINLESPCFQVSSLWKFILQWQDTLAPGKHTQGERDSRHFIHAWVSMSAHEIKPLHIILRGFVHLTHMLAFN